MVMNIDQVTKASILIAKRNLLSINIDILQKETIQQIRFYKNSASNAYPCLTIYDDCLTSISKAIVTVLEVELFSVDRQLLDMGISLK